MPSQVISCIIDRCKDQQMPESVLSIVRNRLKSEKSIDADHLRAFLNAFDSVTTSVMPQDPLSVTTRMVQDIESRLKTLKTSPLHQQSTLEFKQNLLDINSDLLILHKWLLEYIATSVQPVSQFPATRFLPQFTAHSAGGYFTQVAQPDATIMQRYSYQLGR